MSSRECNVLTVKEFARAESPRLLEKSNRSFYSIPGQGKQQYWGRDKLKAIDNFRGATTPHRFDYYQTKVARVR